MSPVAAGIDAGTQVHLAIEAHVAVITIDRPHARNAISLQTMAELAPALQTVEHSDARVLVLRGAGEHAFVSGGDLKELAAIRDEAGAVAMATTMRRLLDSLAAFPLPVIAAVNGHARGGGAEVAVAADLRIMAEDATIGFNQTKLAIMPAWGGAERLVELVGAAQALALIGTARVLNAAEALHLRVVEYTAPRERFEAAWRELARSFADMPPELARSLKAVIAAARPRVHRELEADAVRRFAQLWVADEHWQAATAQGTRRRQ
jgi:enoyl-CoA hydratase